MVRRPQQNQRRRDDVFPRTKDLPAESPLGWVGNKDRFLRQLLICDIEEITGRRLCVYFSSSYLRTGICNDDVARLYEIVTAGNSAPYDLMLETSGGETDATEALISMLREINRDFRVIVPSRAKSNGTIIGLAATKIIMGVTSELGPIEPYILGWPVSVYRDENVIRKEPKPARIADDVYRQTEKLAKQVLETGMMKGKTPAEVTAVVQQLCTRNVYPSHGSVINGREAKELGLSVEVLLPSDKLWQKLWLLHTMYAFDADQTGVGKFFEGNYESVGIIGDDPDGELDENDYDPGE